MAKYEIKPKLSRDYVLSQLSEAQIFEFYMGIPVKIGGGLIRNPTRKDESPTANFFEKYGKLYFKDFAGKGFHHGDCFNLVEYLHGGTFIEVMARIMRDMKGEIRDGQQQSTPFLFKAEHETTIKIKVRGWMPEDKEFWQPYFIRIVDLEKYWVDPVEYAWVNEQLRYIYDKDDRCYSYYYGENRRKLYFPDRGIMRFRQNSQAVQGFRQLPSKGDLCILTKSLKDVIVLDRMGFASCALQAEGSLYTEALHNELSGRFSQVVTFYDNDETGRRYAAKIYDQFDVPYIEIPKITGIKDISDYVKEKKSLDEGKRLVEKLLLDVL